MVLTINNLENCFNAAINRHKKYVALLVNMDRDSKPEIIIHQNEDFENKLSYYKSTYNEYLDHKFIDGTHIVNFTYGDSLSEIEEDLISFNKAIDSKARSELKKPPDPPNPLPLKTIKETLF